MPGNVDSAKGANAAPFTNPRRVIPRILGLLALTKLPLSAGLPLQSFFPNRSFLNATPELHFRLRPDATAENVSVKLRVAHHGAAKDRSLRWNHLLEDAMRLVIEQKMPV